MERKIRILRVWIRVNRMLHLYNFEHLTLIAVRLIPKIEALVLDAGKPIELLNNLDL